jgi:hypothetical protein
MRHVTQLIDRHLSQSQDMMYLKRKREREREKKREGQTLERAYGWGGVHVDQKSYDTTYCTWEREQRHQSKRKSGTLLIKS